MLRRISSSRTVGCLLVITLMLLSINPSSGQSVLREYWTEIEGSRVSDLTNHPDFPDNPSGHTFPQIFEGEPLFDDHYGTRLRAYVIPPETGNYLFWISGDDECQLFVSTDSTPANKDLVATVPTWTSYRKWDQFPEQVTDFIQLEAGARYFVEALQKEGTGGDSISVGWTLPNGDLERPIPGNRLETYQISQDPPTIIAHPEDQMSVEGNEVKFQVTATGAEPLTYQWQKNGVNLDGEEDSTLVLHSVLIQEDDSRFRCVVTNNKGTVFSDEAVLRVGSEAIPPEVVRLNPPHGSTVHSLTSFEVMFSEAVSGIDAEDLLINGQPALEVNGLGAGPYLFEFDSPEMEEVTFTWSDTHGIQDRAAAPNFFTGGHWSISLDPAFIPADVVINEFMASNQSGLTDQSGQPQDWIELHNRSESAVNLSGWSLSDDEDLPGKWIFPEITLGSGQYLVVFASGLDLTQEELHTNFKLNASGESLGLFGPGSPRKAVDEFPEGYPNQSIDHSYGRAEDGEWHYFAGTTPGWANPSPSILGLLSPPEFSVTRGIFNHPFALALSSDSPGIKIRYTTDGSTPSANHGTVASGLIQIDTNTILRAISTRTGYLPSKVITHSYFIGEDTSILSLPVLSVVTDEENLFGPTGIMETNPRNTLNRGIAWERPASAEWIFPEEGSDIQIDCGLRVQGGNYIRGRYSPAAAPPAGKYSFRFYFRGDYGEGSLEYPLFPFTAVDEFEVVSLRAGMNDHTSPFIVDELVRRLSKDMGMVSAVGSFANFFLNGAYQGYYNPCERIDENFLNSYLGTVGDWDIIAQSGEIRAGDANEWNRLIAAAAADNIDLSNIESYRAVTELLDIDNFIDYLLLNIYCDTGDWPHNNWRAARRRLPGSKWFFIAWDAEWALGNNNSGVDDNSLTTNLTGNSEISRMFNNLRLSPEFQLRFADRVHRHFATEGALNRNNVIDRFDSLRLQMQGVLPTLPATIRVTWAAQRYNNIVPHLQAYNLHASDNAPVFSQPAGRVAQGQELEITSAQGTVYYTTDGSDPRRSAVDSIQNHILLTESAPKRILIPTSASEGGDWTGVNEAFDDSGWMEGSGGVGYDINDDYAPLIQTDLEEAMHGLTPTAYLRIPFQIAPGQKDTFDQLILGLRYEDGFVAYLNGVEIASTNSPDTPRWDSNATEQTTDSLAVILQQIDISTHIPELKEGSNILAIHGLNIGTTSSDFLISAQLTSTISTGSGPFSASARSYSEPLVLNESISLHARAFFNNEWSALSEISYQVNSMGLPLRFSEIMYNPPGGDAFEFVELVNTSPNPVDLSGMSLEGINFTFLNGSTLAGHEPLILISNNDPEAFAVRYPGVAWAGTFGGALSNGGERLTLFSADGAIITSVKYGDSVLWPEAADGLGASLENMNLQGDPDLPIHWSVREEAGGTPMQTPAPLPPAVDIRLNEVMAANTRAVLHGTNYPDWVEIINSGKTPVDLSGWSLTDTVEDPQQFVFPENTRLDPDSLLVIWLAPDSPGPGLYAGFSLSRDGEQIALFDATQTLRDHLKFGRQLPDYSLGRIQGKWRLNSPTPAAENSATELASPTHLVINEWLPIPLEGEDGWVELYNTSGSLPVTLAGLYIESGNSLQQLHNHAFVPAQGHVLLMTNGGHGREELWFESISSSSEILLYNSVGHEIDEISYRAARAGTSRGRFPDGDDGIQSFPNPTPGSPNSTDPYRGPFFSEIMAWNEGAVLNSVGGSSAWMELRHTGTTDWDLAGHGLGKGTGNSPDWIFPDNTILTAGDYLLVWCDPSRPASTGAEPDLNTGWDVSNQGETIRLFDASGQIVNEARFGFQLTGQSIGSGTGSHWRLMAEPTPGSDNSDLAVLGDYQSLSINEWLADADQGDDWIEIYNPEALPISLSQLSITDEPSVAGEEKHIIGEASFAASQSWVKFLADGQLSKGLNHLGFSLDQSGEMIRVYSPTRRIINEVFFGAQQLHVSQGRLPDGSETFSLLYPTPAAANSTEPPFDGDTDGDGIPDEWEIMYQLNPYSSKDGDADKDNDGLSNWEEFQRNSNPNDPTDSLLLTVSLDSEDSVTLTFLALENRPYTLQSSDSLAHESPWQEHSVISAEPETRVIQVTDTWPATVNYRFYRVLIH